MKIVLPSLKRSQVPQATRGRRYPSLPTPEPAVGALQVIPGSFTFLPSTSQSRCQFLGPTVEQDSADWRPGLGTSCLCLLAAPQSCEEASKFLSCALTASSHCLFCLLSLFLPSLLFSLPSHSSSPFLSSPPQRSMTLSLAHLSQSPSLSGGFPGGSGTLKSHLTEGLTVYIPDCPLPCSGGPGWRSEA